MRNLIIIALLLFIYGCCRCDKKLDKENNLTVKTVKDYARHKYRFLDSLYYSEAYDRYGRTFSVERYRLKHNNLYPPREVLKLHFTQEEINKKSIRILEATWDISATENITVWYEDTFTTIKPIDTLFWDKGTEW